MFCSSPLGLKRLCVHLHIDHLCCHIALKTKTSLIAVSMTSPQNVSHRGGGAFGPQVAVPSSPVPDEVDEIETVAINPTETIVAAAEQLNAEFIQQQSESVRVTLPTRSSRT